MLPDKIYHTPLLPRRQTAARMTGSFNRWCVFLSHVGAEQQTKIVEEKLSERPRRAQRRQDHLRQLVQNRVYRPMYAFKSFNSGHAHIVCKSRKRRAGNVIMHPVDRTAITDPRIGLKIVNTHAARGPARNVGIAIIDPDLA